MRMHMIQKDEQTQEAELLAICAFENPSLPEQTFRPCRQVVAIEHCDTHAVDWVAQANAHAVHTFDIKGANVRKILLAIAVLPPR